MPKEFSRMDRVSEQCRRVLAELIQRHIDDPRVGFITVSDVQVTKDLSRARVFVSCLEGEERANDSVLVLNQNAAMLRHELAREVRMRTIPVLKFVYDESIAYGSHLNQLLQEIKD